MPTPLEIEEHDEPDGGSTVVLRGELDVGSADRVEERLGALARARRRVTVDMRELTFMDSTGVRLVWAMSTAAANDGFELALIQGPEQIRSVFEMSGLISRLPFVDP
jgi:anti-anti-sigma factor